MFPLVTHPLHQQTPAMPLQPQLRSEGPDVYLATRVGAGESCDLGATHIHRTSCSRYIGKRCCLGSHDAVDPIWGWRRHLPHHLSSAESLATTRLFLTRKGCLATGLDCGFVLLPLGLFKFKKKTSYPFAFFTRVLNRGLEIQLSFVEGTRSHLCELSKTKAR